MGESYSAGLNGRSSFESCWATGRSCQLQNHWSIPSSPLYSTLSRLSTQFQGLFLTNFFPDAHATPTSSFRLAGTTGLKPVCQEKTATGTTGPASQRSILRIAAGLSTHGGKKIARAPGLRRPPARGEFRRIKHLSRAFSYNRAARSRGSIMAAMTQRSSGFLFYRRGTDADCVGAAGLRRRRGRTRLYAH